MNEERTPDQENKLNIEREEHEIDPEQSPAPDQFGVGTEPCPRCGGTGQLNGQRCAHCEGTGYVTVTITPPY